MVSEIRERSVKSLHFRLKVGLPESGSNPICPHTKNLSWIELLLLAYTKMDVDEWFRSQLRHLASWRLLRICDAYQNHICSLRYFYRECSALTGTKSCT